MPQVVVSALLSQIPATQPFVHVSSQLFFGSVFAVTAMHLPSMPPVKAPSQDLHPFAPPVQALSQQTMPVPIVTHAPEHWFVAVHVVPSDCFGLQTPVSQ